MALSRLMLKAFRNVLRMRSLNPKGFQDRSAVEFIPRLLLDAFTGVEEFHGGFDHVFFLSGEGIELFENIKQEPALVNFLLWGDGALNHDADEENAFDFQLVFGFVQVDFAEAFDNPGFEIVQKTALNFWDGD